MRQFLRNLTPDEQVGLLFVLLFGLLALASLGGLLMSLRERRQGETDPGASSRLQGYHQVLRNSWLMALVFWIGWAAGPGVANLLFGLVSFFILREFISLSPTRRGDHRSLLLVFFAVLPLQYVLVWQHRLDLLTVFIPVYAFLALPVASALGNDPERFLERNAKLQWGVMVCVYGMSHVPALMLLEFPGFVGKSAFLVFYLVVVVQTCMLVQHLVNRRLSKPVAPQISLAFHWKGLGAGLLAGGLTGVLLTGITPFNPGRGLGMALIACAAGSLGHLVMKGIKRDRGVTQWGLGGGAVTGASGLLDRVDALCFAAPVFFHSVRWTFDL